MRETGGWDCGWRDNVLLEVEGEWSELQDVVGRGGGFLVPKCGIIISRGGVGGAGGMPGRESGGDHAWWCSK